MPAAQSCVYSLRLSGGVRVAQCQREGRWRSPFFSLLDGARELMFIADDEDDEDDEGEGRKERTHNRCRERARCQR